MGQSLHNTWGIERKPRNYGHCPYLDCSVDKERNEKPVKNTEKKKKTVRSTRKEIKYFAKMVNYD